MTRIYTAVHIDRPPAELFDFVTTPGNWPQWHPSSLHVTGASDHSLEVGEQVTEAFSVAGRKGEVIWSAIERDEPLRWVIDGQIVGHDMGGQIAYTLRPDGAGTLFEREFTYPTPTIFFTLMDRFMVRRRVQSESDQAARQLKALLEEDERVSVPGDRANDKSRNKSTTNSYYFLNVWSLPAEPSQVWPYIVDGKAYPEWWGMVYDKVESLNELTNEQVGAKAAVTAHGRLPYHIHFTSEITQVEAPALLSLKAYGDLIGNGTWRLTPTSEGTQVTFEWIVEADKPILRLLSPLVKPMLEDNHRWTMHEGEKALKALLKESKQPSHQATMDEGTLVGSSAS